MPVGTLTIEVVKATGGSLKGSGRVRVGLAVGRSDKKYTDYTKMATFSTNVKFGATFTFAVDNTSDALTVLMEQKSKEYPDGAQMGRQSVTLAHLPNGRQVSKWYQLNNQVVVLLNLLYNMTYSNVEELGMTVYPAPEAQLEVLFPEAHVDLRSHAPHIVDYCAVVGCNLEQLAQMSVLPSNDLVEQMGLIPRVIERYPPEDRKSFPLPEQLPLFAFPDGYRLRRCTNMRLGPPAPIWRCFQLNDGTFAVHVASVVFWRLYRHPTGTLVWLPQCVALLSHYPYYPQFKVFLDILYARFCKHTTARVLSICLDGDAKATGNGDDDDQEEDDENAKLALSWESSSSSSSKKKKKKRAKKKQQKHRKTADELDVDENDLSIEQYVVLLCKEAPLPVHGGPTITLPLGRYGVAPLHFRFPAREFDFPHLELSLIKLFQILDVDLVVRVVCCLLTEHQVLVHSRQKSLLNFVEECILALLFPFRWEHVFIPLLPKALSSVLQAPVPFLVGLDSGALTTELLEHLDDHSVIVVDLDSCCLRSSLPPPQFPYELSIPLRRKIMQLCRPQVFEADTVFDEDDEGEEEDIRLREEHEREAGRGLWESPDPVKQFQVRAAFLKFYEALLRDYRNFLFFVDGEKPTFEMVPYLKHREDARQFLSRFLETQLFTAFMDTHVENPSLLKDLIVYLARRTPEQVEEQLDPAGYLDVPLPHRLPAEILERRNADEGSVHAAVIKGKWNLFVEGRFVEPRKLQDPTRSLRSIHDDDDDDDDDDDERKERREQEREEETKARSPAAAAAAAAQRTKLTTARLLIKSRMEEAKPEKETRLVRVMEPLLEEYEPPEDHVADDTKVEEGIVMDVAELTAVAELLKFQHWRDLMVRVCEWHQLHEIERKVSPDSFTGLALLFNIAIQESHAYSDFVNAKALLEVSGKVYQEVDDGNGVDRDYLCYSVKQHKMWKDMAFWVFSLQHEVDMLDDGGLGEAEMHDYLFDVLGKFIFTILSMGLPVEFTQKFIEDRCTHYQMADDQRMTLSKLAVNIYHTARAQPNTGVVGSGANSPGPSD